MKTFKETETEFLEGLFENYITSNHSSYLRFMREAMINKCKHSIKKDAVALELGCEIGYMTSLISPLVNSLDVIDGSKSFINEAKKRNLQNVTFYNKLFEELNECDKYDYVFMSHVVEHLANPSFVLEKVKTALKYSGVLFITVPNAMAASRQLAKEMGILDSLYELTPNDIRGGHRIVYDSNSIFEQLNEVDFYIEDISGILFKPFCDFQMDYLIDSGFLSKEHLDGLLLLGDKYPDLCADIFIKAVKA